MDLWATLGISREVGLAAVVVGIAVVLLGARWVMRRSRTPDRVWVDLSGRD
jgi:hypothetical protein